LKEGLGELNNRKEKEKESKMFCFSKTTNKTKQTVIRV